MKKLRALIYRLSAAIQETVFVWWLWLPVTAFRYRKSKRVPVIASLTSYPARIQKAWRSIETLLRQTNIPESLILVLSLEEFPDRKLPRKLQEQMKRGLKVLWTTQNGRSYDKLLPVMHAYATTPIITFDDDKYFPSTLIEQLFSAHQDNPAHIVGARGWNIVRTKRTNEFRFGVDWERLVNAQKGDFLHLPGGNGSLYPPGTLSDQVLNLDEALRVCPTTDDIWIWACAIQAKTPFLCLGLAAHKVVGAQAFTPSLSAVNSQNEDQQFQAALDHFRLRSQLDNQ